MRTFVGFPAETPHFITPGIDQMSKQALGAARGGDENLTVRYHA